MLQSLDVISVNLWQIIISLANLAILFFILKKLLFKPVKKVLDDRQKTLEDKYDKADMAIAQAQENKLAWEEKLKSAQNDADTIIRKASNDAAYRGERIIAEAKDKADGIVRQAQTEAELELLKAKAGIKREIVDVSYALTEKLLGREINTDDHHAMIDSFIEKIGDNNDENGNE